MNKLLENAEKLAEISLTIGAIKLSPSKPFVWASGYQMPIYNDNRMLLGKYAHRKFVCDSFYDIIEAERMDFDIVVGTSTAGISPGTTLADRLQMPFIYVRDKPKDRGMRSRIEGIDAERGLGGKRAILIEDLISMGGSSASAVDGIRKAGGEIAFCLSIFTYRLTESRKMFLGEMPFNKTESLAQPCSTRSILDFDTLLKVAKKRLVINNIDLELLYKWRADPLSWGERRGFPRVVK